MLRKSYEKANRCLTDVMIRLEAVVRVVMIKIEVVPKTVRVTNVTRKFISYFVRFVLILRIIFEKKVLNLFLSLFLSVKYWVKPEARESLCFSKLISLIFLDVH
jgi:hypothetical protein